MGGNILTGALLVGAVVYLSKQKADKLASQITWAFDGVDFDGVGLEGGLNLRLLPRIRIINKSSLTIPIDKFEGKILYLGKDLLSIKSEGNPNIKANSETVLRYGVGVSKNHLAQVFGVSLAEVWANKAKYLRPSNFVMAGTITFRMSGVVVEHDISQPFVFS